MSLELLEYLVTWSRVVGVSMELFEGDDSSKEDGSFLCDGELDGGVASNKGVCIPCVCVCIDSQDVKGDAVGGNVWKAMIYLYLDR